MSDTSLLLGLPLIQAAQAQKHVTHNEALRLLDLVVQLSVQDRHRATPPDAPKDGDRHIVAGGAIGPWVGQDGKIAVYEGTGWTFVMPQTGWRAHVQAESQTVIRNGTRWDSPKAQTFGINATADNTNRLAVSAPATLLTHEGAGHQLKINKAATPDTASLLFQSNWSGRAEMGLTGNDAFAIKVSADGGTFNTALSTNPTSGTVTLPAGAALSDGTAAAPALSFAADADTGLSRPAANQIAFVTGGAQRAVLSNAGLKLDVPLTGNAVTQNAQDSTAGRVTRTGDFGVGGYTADASSDAQNVTGFSRATSGTRPDTSSWHLMHMGRAAAGQAAQFALRDGSATEAGQAAIRHRTSAGTWSDWNPMIGRQNLLGTVNQTAGVPTGAVMERGSNANGDYVRFADGTQICTRICDVNVASTTSQSFTTAAAFVSGGITGATVSYLTSTPHAALQMTNIRAFGCSQSTFFLRLLTPGTSSDAASNGERIVMTATGRWF